MIAKAKAVMMATLCIRPNLNDQHCTLYDRVSKLLESVEWSDVTFLVRDEVIKAHKLILAISSPVFKVMLYGPLAENNEIKICDIEPQVFQLLIDFIYKDEVVIDNLENACGLLYAAKKYMLPYLSEMCIKYIKKCMSVVNVLFIYNFAEWIQESSLLEDSLSLICKHADIILKNYSFHISDICFIKILQESSLNISEKDLIEFSWIWSHNECLKRNIFPTNESQRQLLINSRILDNIRFLALTKDDVNWLKETDLLLAEEVNDLEYLMQNPKEHVDKKSSFNFFSLNDNRLFRNPLPFEWVFCHRPAIRSTKPLVINNSSHPESIRLNLRCKKTVFIGGILISSRQSLDVCHKKSQVDSYLENIVMKFYIAKDSEECLSVVAFNKVAQYNNTILVKFSQPCLMNEEDLYTVSISWPGKKYQLLKYPLCYRPSTTVSQNATFMFEDEHELNSSNGSLFEGLMFCI